MTAADVKVCMLHLPSLVMSGQARLMMPAETNEDATIKVFQRFFMWVSKRCDSSK